MHERESRSDLHGVPAFGGVALTVAAVAAMYGLILGLSALNALGEGRDLQSAAAHVQGDLITLTLAQLAGMGSALFIGLRVFEPDASLRETLRAKPIRLRTLALCLTAGAALQFPLAELGNLLHAHVFGPDPLERQVALQRMIEARSAWEGLSVVACLVAAVPAMEEAFFRGLLMFGFARRYSAGFAVLLSACLFGVVHLGAVPALYALVAGLVLGWVARTTGSLWSSIAVHAAVNAMPVLLPEHALPIPGFNVPSATPSHLSTWILWPAIAVALGSLAWISRIEYAHAR